MQRDRTTDNANRELTDDKKKSEKKKREKALRFPPYSWRLSVRSLSLACYYYSLAAQALIAALARWEKMQY